MQDPAIVSPGIRYGTGAPSIVDTGRSIQ